MSNNVRPFRRPGGRPVTARPRYQTAVVHHLFKEYDEAVREERRVCGVVPPPDELPDEAPVCGDECLAARVRTRDAKERLLRATRDLNPP